jgi:uncharacterized protein
VKSRTFFTVYFLDCIYYLFERLKKPLPRIFMSRKIKVLSIDGGGIRGIIPALVLAHIEELTGRPISESFDLIAGTSTGGILSLGLTKPDANGKPQYRARDLIKFYEEDGQRVFTRSFWRRVYTIENLLEERYTPYGIESVLDKYFGEARLKDAITEVLITSYEIERRISFFFKSSNARIGPSHDFSMSDVARATSAAPTYFEPAKLLKSDGSDYYALVDGGIFANNPAMCAYVEAKSMFPDAEEILVVSLGTGEQVKRLPYDDAKRWGLAQWARPMLGVVFDGVSDTVDYQLKKLLPPTSKGLMRYHRFQTRLDLGGDEMDDTSPQNLRFLRLLAEDMILQRSFEFELLAKQLLVD